MTIQCKVVSLTYLNTKTLAVCLQAESDFDFLAGQYVLLDLGDSGKFPFSIASMPTGNNQFELHLGGISDQSALLAGVKYLQSCFEAEHLVKVGAASGNAWLRDSPSPIVLIAGGSGYTYTRSILQAALHQDPDRYLTLYWGAYTESDLYEHDYLTGLTKEYTNFHYIPVTEMASAHSVTRQAKLLDVVYQDADFLALPDVYICGRYEMVQSASRYLESQYEGSLTLYSDALS
ncbi:hypothetical protein [Photobacterium kagoshimensis]|uniref:hypothetical protein n=1 Tax=Photobacterium kagoshimensis TaxID=2910242 RepID=UPI003D14AA3B